MKVLVSSPHTDDAELGCGGTIIKFLEEKHDIFGLHFRPLRIYYPLASQKYLEEKIF